MEQLKQENIRSLFIDLSSVVANASAETWYPDILSRIGDGLGLQQDILKWWKNGKGLGPSQRFYQFFQDILFKEIAENIIIFFDEIDVLQTMNFSNDFFSVLRAVYQSQSIGPGRKRLSFVLAGTSGLILNSPQSPLFNLGYHIELTYFTIEETAPLATQLHSDPSQFLEWVFEWTSGHPYLTMRLFSALGTKEERLTKEAVTQAVQEIFLGSERQDSHLNYVQGMLLRHSEKTADILRLYKQVLENVNVKDDYRSTTYAYLKMSGVVRQVPPNLLCVGNQIYATVFDHKWVKEQLSLLGLEDTDTPAPENNTAVSAIPQPEIDEAEKARSLQSAIEANLLANNRSQPVYNDRAQGEDQLGIKDEVEALAETLLLRDVEPPIAVGVMGGWGSGKSFVMYLISKHVEQTRCKIVKRGWSTQDKDPDVPAYVGHVYQISFNAWTYAKSNLWASLMDTIFINLNRQMQIEQLLAHRDCSPKDTTNLAEDVRKSMLAGGKEFIKIYGESLTFDQDKELETWKENLEYWAHHLFKGNLLWSVMRRRQEENLDRLKDTEEQLKQLKSQRDQFEKSRSPEKKNINLDPASAKACAQTMLTALAAFIPEQVGKTAVQTLEQQNVTEEDIRQALKDTWEVKGLIDTIFAMFREYKFLRLLTLLFLLLGIILVTVPLPNIDVIQRQTAAVVSFIVTALPFVSASLVWWQKVASFNAKAKVILEDAYKNQQAKQAEEIANSTKKSPTQKIADLQKEVSQGSIAAYDTLINLLEAQAEAERQLIGPSAKYSSLMEFVQSRLDAATYENQLGLMHQVRQDIDELTYSLADGAREDVFPRGKPRVILYIDDLDRCPPQRVVEILEAVQLLLNTKLFVIILGLDTRYVTRALEKEYKEILQHEGDPSGLDYIEKIIQIPYRVRPIERNGLQKYLAMQMDVEKLPEPEPEPIVQPAQRDVPVQSTPLTEPQPRAESIASTHPAAEEPAQALTATEPVKATDAKEPEQPKLPEIELPAAVIQFKHEDLLDLTACCQQIPLSPRSIKRLVNVFKLIKIFWFRADKEADIAGRDQPRPVKQAAMCMLALSSAYPEVMREVFVHLEGLYRQGKEQSVLFTELNSIKLPPGSAHDLAWQLQKYKGDVSTLKMMAGNEQDKLSQLTLKDFKLSTFNIVRSFSFVGDPMYWTDGEDDTSRANGKSQAKPTARRKKSKEPSTLAELTGNLDSKGGE